MPESACRKALADAFLNHQTMEFRLGSASHAGLLLSRYLYIPVKDDQHSDYRKELYKSVRRACHRSAKLYELAYGRWNDAIAANAPDTASIGEGDFTVQGRMVSGLSGENILETGLTLHHTYGVPIIPGSALKGLAAHYCHQVWGTKDKRFKYPEKDKTCGLYHRYIFGDTGEKEEDEGAGHITFHDAWITPETLGTALVNDVITPHHPDYYMPDSKDNPLPPADYDEPNPITFLSVHGTFRIYLSCDIPDNGGKEWVDLTMRLLKDALKDWGIGGKTSSGYGRMGDGDNVG